MSSNYFGVLVVGTAVHDHVVYAGNLSNHFTDGVLAGKADPDPNVTAPSLYTDRSGGSAVNSTLALQPIASALGMEVTIYKCMRLGREHNNPGKTLILKEMGNPQPGDKTIMDSMFGRDYAVPTNLIIENGNAEQQGRFARRGHKTHHPLYEGITEDIRHAVDRSGFVLGNSHPPEETAIAFDAASRDGAQTILDYSENGSEEAKKRAASLLFEADYVVAPHDALLPGMTEINPRELMRRMIEDYGCRHVAISNSNESVLVYDNGAEFTIDIPPGPVRNTNGAGDTRDAALCAALAKGYGFSQAIQVATDIATFYVRQPNRDAFAENIHQHILFSPLYRDLPRPQHQQRQAESGGWTPEAVIA